MGYGAQSLYQPTPLELPVNPLGQVGLADPSSYAGFVNPGSQTLGSVQSLLPPPPTPAWGGGVPGAGFTPPPTSGFALGSGQGAGFLANAGGARGLAQNAGLGTLIYGLGNGLPGWASRYQNPFPTAGLLNPQQQNALTGGLQRTLRGAGAGTAIAGPIGGVAEGGFGAGDAAGQLAGNYAGSQADKAGVGWAKAPLAGLTAIAGGPLGLAAGSGILGKDTPMQGAMNMLGKLPGIGGVFGGGSDAAADTSTKGPSPDQQAAADSQRVARTPGAMVGAMQKMGIGQEYQQALMSDYESNIAYQVQQAAAGVPMTVPKLDDKGNVQYEGTGDKKKVVTEQRIPTHDEIVQMAYGDTMSKLPAILAQQSDDADQTRRTAATQAAIAQWMPQVSAPYQAASAQLGQLGQTAVAGMGGAAQNYMNVATQGNNQYAASLNNALSLIPGYLAQQQHDSQLQQLQQQLIQSEIQRQIAAGKNQAGGSTDDALTNALTGG